ncbi:MAG TPA: hypothetical protein VF629_13825 [Hymenobacter sp.]|jgi:precorrin-2 methylase|uniref:hypothetical protein n=1 Tax=Hymenobacter sp. TaxID=1898978 RepID=UPI002ED7C46F
MRLIAFRPEYQLTVDDTKNLIFYQNFEPMQEATALPHYLEDWHAALATVKPGFTILSDMQVINHGSPQLHTSFKTVEQLIVERSVRMVAEIHVPGVSTGRRAAAVTTSLAMPVRQFLNLWDAAQFLDELNAVPEVNLAEVG